MAQSITTDLFKFVAVRPPQSVHPSRSGRTFIRDARAATAEGARHLAALARALAAPGVARERWAGLDLGPLGPPASAHRLLVERYEQLDPDAAPPGGADVLGELELDAERLGHGDEVVEQAWDALYVADATGHDAGPRLEVPMAALRVLHFAASLADDPAPARAEALNALRATPLLPDLLRQPPGTPPPVVDQPDDDPAHSRLSPRSRQLQALATEIEETTRLRDTLRSAAALHTPTVTETAGPADGPHAGGGPDREVSPAARFAITTVPSVVETLGDAANARQSALFERLRIPEAATVPVAVQALDAHLARLGEQAGAVAGDPEFIGYLREAKGAIGEMSAGEASSAATVVAMLDPGTAPDVNVAGRITPLGIGDLKVVKQTLLAYVPGEVAHIENVLEGESKERKHRKLDRTETTLFTSEEETRSTERDTQSTDRQELKRETAQTIKEDMSVKAGLTVTATLGPVVTTATGEFAYSTSKEDSVKSSSNFAREIVERSVDKVETKTRTERTTKTLSEVEEINTHGLDNATPGNGNVVGIYRWVDKRYRAQVYNYGVRLLLEFVVPEPAAFYRAAQAGRAHREVDAPLPPPLTNIKGGPLTVNDITEADYPIYVSKFRAAGVTPPPPFYAYSGTSIVKEGLEEAKTVAMATKELVVPADYTLQYYSATVSIIWTNYPQFALQVGRDPYVILNDQSGRGHAMTTTQEGAPGSVQFPAATVPVSVASYDVLAFAVNVQGLSTRNDSAMDRWRLQTYDKLVAAQQALQTAYDQKVAQAEAAAGIAIAGQNPAVNRTVEQTELKKLCITMMTGQHFKQFKAMTDPGDKPAHHPEVDVLAALHDGPIVQFFEQAFEWEQMTYLFYPYYWGRKSNWVEVSDQSDPDPLFSHFLSAGAARVLVPVPLAYKDAVEYLLQTDKPDLADRVWRGGPRPGLDSPLYESIAEELRDQTDDLGGATPEGDPWEFTLPTTLVWLQPDSTLPTYE